MRDTVHRISMLKQSIAVLFVFVYCISLFSQQAYKEKDLTDGGTICGRVTLAGTSPSIPKMVVTKNADLCGALKPSPRLSVGKSGGVANAIVYLENIAEGKKCTAAKKFQLKQSQCEYSPHVMIISPGSHLEIVNNDKILHNVHAYDCGHALKSVFNIAQPIKGQCTPVNDAQLSKAGLIETTCDAGHPWMSAYIMVASHPYYAVTDNDGNFTLSDVPPGKYRLKMWHEGVAIAKTETENGKAKKYVYEEPYELTSDVSVAPHGNASANFELKLK